MDANDFSQAKPFHGIEIRQLGAGQMGARKVEQTKLRKRRRKLNGIHRQIFRPSVHFDSPTHHASIRSRRQTSRFGHANHRNPLAAVGILYFGFYRQRRNRAVRDKGRQRRRIMPFRFVRTKSCNLTAVLNADVQRPALRIGQAKHSIEHRPLGQPSGWLRLELNRNRLFRRKLLQ